jgi:hypothetical protein
MCNAGWNNLAKRNLDKINYLNCFMLGILILIDKENLKFLIYLFGFKWVGKRKVRGVSIS